MFFNKQNLGDFIKTTLAKELQQTQIGEFVKQQGAPKLIAEINKPKIGDKPKTADGIDMGNQVDTGVIPIIYGHIGMSNTQFDLGQKPSEVDAKFVTQTVKMPISEGPIAGVATRQNDYFINILGGETINHFKSVLLNDSFVVESNGAVNFKDIKFEMTYGDGTANKQTATILNTSPITGEEVEAIDDPTNDKLLNDLGDVTAAKGVNNVLYWNTATSRWEAKSFNALLNEAGATYDGGAGGAGGSGGSGGEGGLGGTGGGATSDTAKTYTQWNPPPTHTVISDGGTEKVTTTITEPPITGSAVVPNKGAPLRRLDQTLPYFTTEIDFADVDSTNDTIDLITFFPDGIYKELTTVRTAVDATYTLCGTERPITGSGDLNCLTPNVTIAPDGQSTTTITPATGSVTVYYVLTTTLPDCNNLEFILDEDSYTISATRNGAYKHRKSLAPMSMNAGSGSKEDGIPQPNSISGADECNTTVLDDYNFKNYSLEDYLTTYPDQILKATNTIKVYAWFDNRTEDDEYTISTNAYLNAVEVSKPMDATGLYKTGELTQSAYKLFEPDHGFKSWLADTESETYNLEDNRKYTQFISGEFGATGAPEPLVVQDGLASTGSSGSAGVYGGVGTEGAGGSAGTQGSVTVPSVPDIPTAEMSKDSSYSGDGVADTVILPSVAVTNAAADAVNTLIIRVTQGTVDVVTVGGSVTAIDTNTSAMTLIGTASNLQGTLDSGLKFFSTTATTGDVTITFNISSSEGSSESTRQIRSEAVTEYVAPTFEITVTGTSGYFRCETLTNKFIMNMINGSGTTDEIAEQIKVAINDKTDGSPNWTATRSANVVTVTGPEALGASYNGVEPSNGATSTPLLATNITTITDGVSPSRVTQPKQTTNNLKSKSQFLPAVAFSNPLTASNIAFAQVAYRPIQADGKTDIAELGFYVGGRKIRKPTNSHADFDSWKNAGYSATIGWTNNTADIFLDYLTNTTFGLGNDLIMTAEQQEQLYEDIWNASKWCDVIPPGSSTYASSIDGVIYGAESKFEALQNIANRMYGKFLYLNGNPRLIIEGSAYEYGSYTPTIKKLVNQSNSANLSYQGGSINNIFNIINVKYNEPDNHFRLKEVQYKNQASIDQFGERETSVELWGSTIRQEALWHGAWLYETEAVNAEIVSYIAGWDHQDVLPNDLILLNDTLRPDIQTKGGRIVSVNGTTLTLDRSASGDIAVMGDDGVIYYGTASGTTAMMSSGSYVENAVWNIYNSQTPEANYRVVAIQESEDGIYAVTAHKHDPAKYTRIWANTV